MLDGVGNAVKIEVGKNLYVESKRYLGVVLKPLGGMENDGEHRAGLGDGSFGQDACYAHPAVDIRREIVRSFGLGYVMDQYSVVFFILISDFAESDGLDGKPGIVEFDENGKRVGLVFAFKRKADLDVLIRLRGYRIDGESDRGAFRNNRIGNSRNGNYRECEYYRRKKRNDLFHVSSCRVTVYRNNDTAKFDSYQASFFRLGADARLHVEHESEIEIGQRHVGLYPGKDDGNSRL